jgi:hypothetical protein
MVRTEKWGDSTVEVYNLTITQEGKDNADDCFAHNYHFPGDSREVQAFAQHRTFSCYTGFRTYEFNMMTNRFLSAYVEGYVDGDTNDDTPFFAVGKCTKLK